VDQEVGDADVLPGAGDAGGVGDVADVQLGPAGLQSARPRRVADKAADPSLRALERCRQPAADEAGRAGDEDVRGDAKG
jgi:hypothetical protein